MKIVLDVMGGDHAPEVTVAGAIDAAREFGVSILLVGPEDVVRSELAKHDTAGLDLSVVHAPQFVDMHDKPAEVLRAKPLSTMHIGMDLVRQGEADAFVTCGNTGGALAIALFKLGRIKVDSQRRIHRTHGCPGIGSGVVSPEVVEECAGSYAPSYKALAT